MTTFLIVIIVLALIFDYINGFHDAANSIAMVFKRSGKQQIEQCCPQYSLGNGVSTLVELRGNGISCIMKTH